MSKFTLISLFLLAASLIQAADNTVQNKYKTIQLPQLICPLKPDPPPLIDGELTEWENLPGLIEILPKHVRFGKKKYSGENDLGGSFRICWDKNYLYLAANVIDDKVKVTASGENLWKSDYIGFDIDVSWKPGVKGTFLKRQFAFGFSPGNFSNTGDPLADLQPEFYIFLPVGMADNAKIDVASKRTEDGYTLEIRIPWKLFKLKPKVGTMLAVDVHFSDCDDYKQESMTSLYPGKWIRFKRERLIPLTLADANGKCKK